MYFRLICVKTARHYNELSILLQILFCAIYKECEVTANIDPIFTFISKYLQIYGMSKKMLFRKCL